jgi:hypothetical protein
MQPAASGGEQVRRNTSAGKGARTASTADARRDLPLPESGSNLRKGMRLSRAPGSSAECISEVRQRFCDRPGLVCVWPFRGPPIHALLEQDFIPLLFVNPVTRKGFREVFLRGGSLIDQRNSPRCLNLSIQLHHPTALVSAGRPSYLAPLPPSSPIPSGKPPAHSRSDR